MKIEKNVEANKTIVRLIGDFRSDHIEELRKQVELDQVEIILDLKEITVVDVDVVRFFAACVAEGMQLAHCPRYIQRWLILESES